MEIQFRKVNGFLQRTTDLYEWSVNGQKWYQVHRVNILALQGPSQEREIMNKALQGEVLNLKGLYLRKEKLLLVTGDLNA